MSSKPKPMQKDLEDFSIKSHNYGRISGVSLACHGISDAFLLMHVGVGCKYKTAGQISRHDFISRPNKKEGYTEVSELELVKGSAARIGVYARSWAARRDPAFMAVISSTFLDMTGEDFDKATRETAKTLPCDMAYIRTLGFDGDLFDGYADLNLEILKRTPFRKIKRAKIKNDEVCIIGYMFDRYEMDHAANLAQLRQLLDGIGLKLGPVLLSGQPYSRMLEAARSGIIVVHPYARNILPQIKSLAAGRSIVSADLPMGVAGTRSWLKTVGSAAGVPTATMDRALDKQIRFAKPRFEAFKKLLGGQQRPFAVFADTPLAAGVTRILTELGQRVGLVGLRDKSLGGRKEFLRMTTDCAGNLPPEADILEYPSLRTVVGALQRAKPPQRLAGIVGSSVEMNLLSSIFPDARAWGDFAVVEIGFPSTLYHAISPAPFMGLPGALSLAQRIMDSYP